MIVLAHPLRFSPDPPPWPDFLPELKGMLRVAQRLYGPGTRGRTLVGVTANNDDHRPLTAVANNAVTVYLYTWDAGKRSEFSFWLAHEIIHVLSYVGGTATKLEEGLAAHFSDCYTRLVYGWAPMAPPSWAEAAKLVQHLLALRPDAIRELRGLHSAISSITADNIITVCPACPTALADALASPFTP